MKNNTSQKSVEPNVRLLGELLAEAMRFDLQTGSITISRFNGWDMFMPVWSKRTQFEKSR